jgi:hypothetical protein
MADCFTTFKNIFEISVEDKEEYTKDELLKIQEKLCDETRLKNIRECVETYYPQNSGFHIPQKDVYERFTRSAFQTLTDENLSPTKNLFVIGTGGNKKDCFVCCTPVSNNRYRASLEIKNSLEEVGYNGHLLLFQGGFPNPTGTEMKYAGVPYSFKVFMMLEAKKLGFEKVIWLDSACYALNNPQRLFDILYEDDILFRSFPPPMFSTYDQVVLPQTVTLLNRLTNTEIRDAQKICSIVFGLNMCSPKIENFVKEYYEMVKLGLPFLSYYPEEVVYSAILNKPEYNYNFYKYSEYDKLFVHEAYMNKEGAKYHGYYFLQRDYSKYSNST